MSIPTYTLGYPPDGSSLGETKAIIRDNLDGTFKTLGIDHVNNNGDPGSNPAGYHTVIHQVTQGSNPAAIVGVNQLFSKVASIPSGDTQLFSITGGGGVSQLTGNKSSGDGYVWCSGILIQWGNIASTNSTYTPLLFATNNVAFPNNCYTIFTQPYSNNSIPGSQATVDIKKSSISNTGFTWTFVTNSADYTGFFWVAIGN